MGDDVDKKISASNGSVKERQLYGGMSKTVGQQTQKKGGAIAPAKHLVEKGFFCLINPNFYRKKDGRCSSAFRDNRLAIKMITQTSWTVNLFAKNVGNY